MPIEQRPRVHVFGASGAGCTTLGRALADALGIAHLDADDYFWLPTEVPYTQPSPRAERLARLRDDLAHHDAWVISGSICGWGDPIAEAFTLAVYLRTPTSLRLTRLRARESARFGDAIEPGGAAHARHEAFLAWASAYDDGDASMRSRALHEAWRALLQCPGLDVDGERSVEESVAQVLLAIA